MPIVDVEQVGDREPGSDAARRLAFARPAGCVADVLEVERTFVHVLFAPSGAGRIAFGGELRE